MKAKKPIRIFLLVLLILMFGTLSVSAVMCAMEEENSEEVGMKFDNLVEYETASVEMPLPMTLEAALKFPADYSGYGGVVFGNYSSDAAAGFKLEITEGGSPRVYVVDAALVKYDVVFDKVNVYSGAKVHIAVALDPSAGVWTCYVNGEVAETVSAAAPAQLAMTSKYTLGCDNGAGNEQYFRGELFGVALYSDARSAEEIALDATGSVDTDGLIAAYAPLSEANEKASVTATGDETYNITYSCNWIKDVPAPENYAYSFAVIGDIQSMTYYYPEHLIEQYEWIRDNAADRKIAFSIGLGDITEKNSDAEYLKVAEAYSKIDGVIPFSIIRGNHDSVAMYDKYVTQDKYGDEITGSYDGTMKNTYRIMQIGKVKYMFMNLDLTLSAGAIEWANEVIASHPECHVIISTHAYKNMGGSYLTLATSGKFGVETDSEDFWNELVSQHENIVMLLYGHSPKNTIWKKQRDDTVHGNTVTEMLINPSETDKVYGGGGFVAMFYFSEDGEQLDVQYYSPTMGAYFMPENQFSLELDTPGTVDFTSVIMNVGSDESERNLTWYSQYDLQGEVRYAKSSDGILPESYSTVSAVATKAVKAGYYTYKATLKGLEASSTYVYQLVVGDVVSECYTFKTYGMGDDFSFAFITDPQVKKSSHSLAWDDTLEKIMNDFGDVSLIVSGGDQTQEPSSEDNFDWFISKYLSSIAIATTNGPPHDNSQLYKDHYNLPNLSTKYGISTCTSDYFYTYNNVLFMHLNVENNDYSGHAEFMENAIADNPDCLWRVVLLHFSFFSAGNHSTDGSVINFRKELAGKFNELGVDVVLSGHDHIYSRSHLMTDGYTVSGDVVTDGVVTDPVGTLYLCGASSTSSGWYDKEHTSDDEYIAFNVDDNRKSVVIFSVSEGSLSLKTYFIDGATPEQYDSFTINKTKDTVRLNKDTDMLEITDGTSRVSLVNAYAYSKATVKAVGGYWALSTDGGTSFTSLGIASADTDSVLRINDSTGYWELSRDGGASFESLGINANTYTVKFVTIPGAGFGEVTDLAAFAPRRFTAPSPDAPEPCMPRGTLAEGNLYSWAWEYYLEGGDGTPVTVFEYGKSYIAYPVSTAIPVASTIYVDTVSNPDEYTYTWLEAWEIVRSCPREEITLVLKSDITLTADDAIVLAVPVNVTLDLGGNRLDTSAIASAVKLAVGSNGSSFKLVTSLEGGALNAGTNNLLEIGTNQGSTVTVQYGSEDTKPLSVESISYLAYPNGNFKYTSTLNLSIYSGSYTVARGVVYVNNVTESASHNIYKINLQGAAFSFFGSESAIVRPKNANFYANVSSYLVAEGCSFTDTYKAYHSSSRYVIHNDIWYGTMTFTDCDFIGMSVGKDHNGIVYASPSAITIGAGCTFTNSPTSFNTGNPLSFLSSKVTLASGCVLARTDANGSAEVMNVADAIEISWENPVGYTEYWKSGVTPSYLGETSFTVGDTTYSLVLIETPTAASENKAYAFKSAEGYLYRYDSENEVWQISTDGGNSYTNLGESAVTPDPEPEYGCILEVDGASQTFSADTDFYSVLAVVNTSAHAGKTIKITLGADMSVKTKTTYNRAATVEIDLAGHTLTYEATGVFQIGATKLHIYSSVAGGELVFASENGFQPVGGAIIFGSEEYKNNLTVSAAGAMLAPKQTADGRTLHYEFLYCTVNFGASNLIRINAIGEGAITFEMKLVGCTVTGDKSVICYNYTKTVGTGTNGGVCNANSYIDVVDTEFISTAESPVAFFGGENFTDRYFGTVSFAGTTFDGYVLNGDLIYSDEALSYNTYYTNNLAGTGYDPTKAITVGEDCVFYNYGTTFNEELSAFSAKNVSVAEGCKLAADTDCVKVISNVFGCILEVDGVSTVYPVDTDFTTVLQAVNTSSHAGKVIKITLGADMTFKTALTYNRAATVEIDLAGHTLTYDADGRFKIGASKLHIYSSVAGGEFVFGDTYRDGFQPSGGAIVFGSEEYKNNLTVSATNEILNPSQTTNGYKLHYEFLYCTVNFGISNLIRINAKGAGAITLEMKLVGCTVIGDKSVICYNYTTTVGATSNGGVCNASSYIDVVDTKFICTAESPVVFFGSDNFTDRYFGTVSFEGTTFDNYVLNGDLIYSDEALSYNTYYTNNLAGTGYDPTKAITVGAGCVFYNYGSTFTDALDAFTAKNVSLAGGCIISNAGDCVKIVAVPRINAASMTIGTNLAMNYRVSLPEGYTADMLSMRFTINDRVLLASASATSSGGCVFTLTAIAPQCMGDTITAELLLDGAVIHTHAAYSVKAYAEDLLGLYPTDEYIGALVRDMLEYGAAAQLYVGYKTDALVNAELDGEVSDVTPTASDKANSITDSTNSSYGFTAAGVRFDYVNKIYVKLTIASGAPADDSVTVTVNGKEVAVSALGEGKYIAYSEDISALAFGEVLTFELKVNGTTVQTLTYSVNSYAYSKYDDGNAMGDLALALYRYGVSAVAYDENK